MKIKYMCITYMLCECVTSKTSGSCGRSHQQLVGRRNSPKLDENVLDSWDRTISIQSRETW